MKIETIFSVNDLVVSKYQRNAIIDPNVGSVFCMEVIEIQSVTCSAGTQVFYQLRTIHGITDTEFVDGVRKRKYVDFAIGSTREGQYIRLREDELVRAPKEVIDLIVFNLASENNPLSNS